MSGKELKLKRVKGQSVSDKELLDDLKAVAIKIDKNTVPQKTYAKLGEFEYSTIIHRFGSWNSALEMAELGISHEQKVTDEKLFENILNLWIHFGRQPVRKDLTSDHSLYSQSPYNRRFGSWTKALTSFVNFINADDSKTKPITRRNSEPDFEKKRTGRDPSLRLRYQVLKRDHFTCMQCGASPAKDLSVELHVDHIMPWSKGGETLINNLQTLCSTCNLGKSNLHD